MEGMEDLTKLEYFAAIALQGMLTANPSAANDSRSRSIIAERAIWMAEELIEKLEENEREKMINAEVDNDGFI